MQRSIPLFRGSGSQEQQIASAYAVKAKINQVHPHLV